jgi:hypothetical protein
VKNSSSQPVTKLSINRSQIILKFTGENASRVTSVMPFEEVDSWRSAGGNILGEREAP